LHVKKPVSVLQEKTFHSIDQVEPAADILKRFATGAMSFGSITGSAYHARHCHEPLRREKQYG
jgi:glutamate synthase domain-containing protein 2